MQRYRYDHISDESSLSCIEPLDTYTGHDIPSSPIGASSVIEKQDTDSECLGIGAAQPLHDLANPTQTFHHCDNEEDNADASKSSHKLLPDLDSQLGALGVSNVECGGLIATKTYSVADFVSRIPRLALLAFSGSLMCTALSVFILIASDQTDQDSWSIQPSVYLAVLAPLGNILLRYCLSEGLVNDWWNLASRRTTLKALHNRWEHGTSLKSAATSFSSFDKISAAKILIAATFAVNPLLQRASRPYNSVIKTSLTVPFRLATTILSIEDAGFISASRGNSTGTVQLSPLMVKVMRDYTNRSPMINEFGQCPGNCTGTIEAAGLVANCSKSINETYQIEHRGLSGPLEDVFLTNTGSESGSIHYNGLNLTALFVQTKLGNDTFGHNQSAPTTSRSCDGVATTVVCSLFYASVEYPIVLRNNIISVDTRTSAVMPFTDNSYVRRSTDASLGFDVAANSVIQSKVTMAPSEEGWEYFSTGPLSNFYMTNKQDGDQITCEITSTDPTDDILTTYNELMFRISLAAGNSSSSDLVAQHYILDGEELVPQYKSRYGYLIAATFISLLACCSVLPAFHGFWRLDRSFSLSPIEIAKAFEAPLLRPSGTGYSDMPVDQLTDYYVGTKEVQYITVTKTYGKYIRRRQKKFAVPEVA